jgi:hypothetical protein
MVDITIVNGVYKPTYNWGAPSSGIIIITYVITQLLGIYGIYVVGLLDYDPVHGVFICLYHHQHSNNWMMPNAK